MALALDSRSKRGFVPRADERDTGDLPEELRGVSFELAKFLRYEVQRRQLCDVEGWVSVDVLIDELGKAGGGRSPLRITIEQVQTVVESSYSKDKARFVLRDYDCKSYIRAADRDKYQSRSRRNEPGSSAPGGPRVTSGYTSNVQSGGGWDNWQSKGNDSGQRRQNGVSQNSKTSGEFDGTWYKERTPICRIEGTRLSWYDGSQKVVSRQGITLRGSQITLPKHLDNPQCQGTLNSGQLMWEDGDIWTRAATDVREGDYTPSTTASTGSSPAGCSGSSSDAHLGTTAHSNIEQPSCTRIGGEPTHLNSTRQPELHLDSGENANVDDVEAVPVGSWKEMRVLADWDAGDAGDGYLSLKKGELLMVKASGDSPDIEEGWAFGESVQNQTEGWFPPTFAQV